MSTIGNNPICNRPQSECRGSAPASNWSRLGLKPESGHSSPYEAFCPLLSGLSRGESTELTSNARIREYGRGQMLLHESDAVTDVKLLLAGAVKHVKNLFNGDTVFLELGLPGDVIGASCVLFETRSPTSVECLRPSRAIVWPLKYFKDVVLQCPVLYQNLLRIEVARCIEIGERFCELATQTVSQRIASQLLRLHQMLSQKAARNPVIHLKREELAQMTGTTIFTVSRILADWELRGIVRSSREALLIRDTESLVGLQNDFA